jgi:diacylglycerol kinase family enzyme
MSMTPDARSNSELLHLQLRTKSAISALIWQLIAAQLRRRVPGFISRYRDGRVVSIQSERSFPVQIDGDFRGWFTSLDIEILPAAARLRVRDGTPAAAAPSA